MRISIIFQNAEIGGAEKIALDTARKLAESHSVTCLVLGSGEFPVSWTEGLTIQYPPYSVQGQFRTYALKAYLHLAKNLTNCDAAIALSPIVTLLLGLSRCNSYKIGWVHFLAEVLRADVSLPIRLAIRKGYQLMDQVVAISSESATQIAKHAGTAPVSIIRNMFCRKPVSSRSNDRPDEPPHIAWIGRISPEKQWGHAVEVSDRLEQMGIPHTLIMLGAGPQEQELRKLCQDKGTRVDYKGVVSDVTSVLEKASCLLLTSKYETWPTVLLEAISCGVPAVAYDCPGGVAELINNSQGPVMVPKNDILAMADAVVPLLSSSQPVHFDFSKVAPELIKQQWEILLRTASCP